MSNKRPYDITRDFKATGNKAIDAVASCLIWHQQRKVALKAVHLKEPYYSWFKMGVELLQGAPLEDGQGLSFNSVEIEKGSRFQVNYILPEPWPVKLEDIMKA